MRTLIPWVVVAAAAVGVAPKGIAQQQGDSPVVVAFRDASRPGTLRVQSMNGDITIRGTNRKDVSIQSRSRGGRPVPRPARPQRRDGEPDPAAGLTRLTPGAGFTVDEAANAIEITTAMRSEDLEIEVPVRTNLRLSSTNQDITVTGVEGEIEVTGNSGDIELTGIAGSIVANSTNGDIKAVLTRATPDKPMAFSSFNGDVDVTLPSALRANLRLQTQNGDMYTNFDLQRMPSPPQAAAPPVVVVQRGKDSTASRSVSITGAPGATVYGSINGGGPEILLRTISGDIFVRKGN